MTKHNRLAKVFVGLLVFLFVLSTSTFIDAANKPFSKGEIINYDITKFKVKVGQAKLVYNGSVEINGQNALSVTFIATGFKFLDQEQIYLDPQTYQPILIKRNLDIFGNKERIMEFYDTDKGKVRIVKKADGKTTEQVIEGGDSFDNIYGFIYRFRQLGLWSKEDMMDLHLPTIDVKIKYIENKELKAADQKFDTYYLRSVPKKYEVWFDSSDQRIPLRIDGALGFGNLSMIFTGQGDQG